MTTNTTHTTEQTCQHTPGTWKYGWESVDQIWAQVTDKNGNIIANVNTETGPDLPPMVSRKMPAEANAKLIAAGPELLEALTALLWQHDNNGGQLCGMALQDARAAINKATA